MEGISENEKYYHLAKVRGMHPFSPPGVPSDGPIFREGWYLGFRLLLSLSLPIRKIDEEGEFARSPCWGLPHRSATHCGPAIVGDDLGTALLFGERAVIFHTVHDGLGDVRPPGG